VHTAEVARSKPERHGNTAKGRLLLGLLTSVWLLRPGLTTYLCNAYFGQFACARAEGVQQSTKSRGRVFGRDFYSGCFETWCACGHERMSKLLIVSQQMGAAVTGRKCDAQACAAIHTSVA